MTRSDIRIIDLTVSELETLINNSVKNSMQNFSNSNQSQSSIKFYTPKEFSHLSSIPYSTVVYKCKVGRLKARQDEPNCPWQIQVSELERMKNESEVDTN